MATTGMPRQRRAKVPADLPEPRGISAQPVTEVLWVDRSKVQANAYNPNVVYPPEMRLLKISLLIDGWTQPLVVREVCRNDTDGDGDCPTCAKTGEGSCRIYELVDGYHRWLAAEDKRVAAMTGGQVPITVIANRGPSETMLSTIRHNRARGSHVVLKMAAVVDAIKDFSDEELEDRLQAEPEEISRLRDHGAMIKRGAGEEFAQGWKPR